MKRIKHTEEQIIKALKRFEAGEKAAALAREFGITLATFYNWKAKYGGMEVSEAKKLKALEEENRRLKRAVADLLLDNQMLKDGANTLNFLSLDFSVSCSHAYRSFVRGAGSDRWRRALACRSLGSNPRW